jgi:maltose O-acetyltransferase
MLFSFCRYWMRYAVRCLPGSVFRRARVALWRAVGFRIHPSANVMASAVLVCGDIEIGAETFVGEEVMLTGGEIRIGRNCDLAPRVIVHAGSHEIGGPQRRAGPCFAGRITVGDGTWIGTGAILVAGADIGRSCVIAAGSVVIGKVPDNSLAAGVPAVVKRVLGEDESSVRPAGRAGDAS